MDSNSSCPSELSKCYFVKQKCHFTEAKSPLLKYFYHLFNPFSANFTKWSLKQLVGNLPMNCLSVFDHFVGLALKWLNVNGDYENKKLIEMHIMPWEEVCYETLNYQLKLLRIKPSTFP